MRGICAKLAILAALAGPAILCASGLPADAADFPWLDEARIGAATTVPVGGGSVNTPYDASIELQALFSPLPAAAQTSNPNLAWLFSPRPLLGASISAEGKTNSAYGGLAWDKTIAGPYFAEFSLSGLVHDQNLYQVYSDRPSPLTTRFLFHESIAIGRQFGPNWRLLAFVDHSSNGDLGTSNVGINRVGLLLGNQFGGPADKSAADAAPPPVASADLSSFSWAGPYLGLSGAFADGEIDLVTPPQPAGNTSYDSVNLAGEGGYNLVFGRLVTGIEADAAVQRIYGDLPINPAGGAASVTSYWLATARGRMGLDVDMPFAPARFLIYATGGAAFSNIVNSYCVAHCVSGGGGFSDQSQDRTGWTAGGGVELPLAPTATFKTEYLYVDLGTLTFSNPAAAHEQFTFTEQLFRAGFNFKLF